MNVLHEPNYMTWPKVKNIVKIVRPNVYENNHFFFFWYRDRFSRYDLLLKIFFSNAPDSQTQINLEELTNTTVCLYILKSSLDFSRTPSSDIHLITTGLPGKYPLKQIKIPDRYRRFLINFVENLYSLILFSTQERQI